MDQSTTCVPVPLHVSVSGNIGAGKTELVNQLGPLLAKPVIEEDVADNPYLALFYAKPKRWAFETQVRFLARRFTDQREKTEEHADTGSVTERSCYEDAIFAALQHKTGVMDDNAYATYRLMFETLEQSSASPLPDVIIYLDVTAETALYRVQKRKRPCESNMKIEYLRALAQEYETFVTDMSTRTCVVKVDWSSYKHDVSALWGCVVKMYQLGIGLHELALGDCV